MDVKRKLSPRVAGIREDPILALRQATNGGKTGKRTGKRVSLN
jgi:hypothetical protein